MLKQCAGRGKQVWGSVLTKGKGLVKREEPLAFVNPGSCTGLNRQKLPLHRKFRMGMTGGGECNKKSTEQHQTHHRRYRFLTHPERKKAAYSHEQAAKES